LSKLFSTIVLLLLY